MSRLPFDPSRIRGAEPPRPSITDRMFTVSQVTALIKGAIETTLPATIHVVGEISNFKRHSSGHLYFTLKDRASELSCVMWRSSTDNMKFEPTDGLEVVATGTMTVFERTGRYQLVARKLEPRGVGALELAFRQLREKLSKEGLFEKARKRRLPRFPQRIAIVTSPTGAAVMDMLRTIHRRYPCVELMLFSVRVQGPGAAMEIVAAIRKVNANRDQLGGIDVMIVGRGGGSLEDLWAFNEEIVARAIFASEIPIISAVGHETDVTIADLVADLRAATPTAAAEIVVPVLAEIQRDFAVVGERLLRGLLTKVAYQSSRLDGFVRSRAFREPLALVRRREQIIDEWLNRLPLRLSQQIQFARRRVDRHEPLLQRIAPHVFLVRTSTRVRDLEHRLRLAVIHRINDSDRVVSRLHQRLERADPQRLLARHRERLAQLSHDLPNTMRHRLALAQARIQHREDVLTAMSYQSVLARGFSITRLKKGRDIVRSIKDVKDHQRIVTQTTDGEFESEVLNKNQLELFEE